MFFGFGSSLLDSLLLEMFGDLVLSTEPGFFLDLALVLFAHGSGLFFIERNTISRE